MDPYRGTYGEPRPAALGALALPPARMPLLARRAAAEAVALRRRLRPER